MVRVNKTHTTCLGDIVMKNNEYKWIVFDPWHDWEICHVICESQCDTSSHNEETANSQSKYHCTDFGRTVGKDSGAIVGEGESVNEMEQYCSEH